MSCDPVPVKSVFTGDGSTKTFQYSFDSALSLVSGIDVEVTVGDTTTAQVEDTDFTANEDASTVTFTVAPVSGAIIVVKRCTTRERQLDYESGSTLLADENLDEDSNRLTAVTQEIEASVEDCMHKTPDGSAWDAEGLEVQNGSPATSGDSLVTLNQVENMIAGSETAEVDNGSVICADGDGAEVDFAITGFRGLNARQIFVFVEGIIQSICEDDPAYSVLNDGDSGYPGSDGGPDYVRFTEAPVDGAHIEIRIIRGTVVSTLGDDSVTGDMIVDGSISEDDLNFGAGTAGRMLFVDAAGNVDVDVPVHDDISDFDAGVLENRLNQMAVPNGDVDMDDNHIVNLTAGSEDSDAANVGQMRTAISNRLKVKKGGIDAANMPTVEGDSISFAIGLGFDPDEITISAKFKSGVGSADNDYHASWRCVFQGATDDQRTISPGRFADNTQPPTLRIRKSASGNSLSIKLVDAGDLTSWTQRSYIAMKYGDA